MRQGASDLKSLRNRRGGGSWAAIALLALASAPDAVSAGQDAAVEANVQLPAYAKDRDLSGNGEALDGPTEVTAAPHWCNATGALVDDIHRHGGESVMRTELGRGRVIERYWNANEEVTIEHGADGNSCLIELRARHAER